MISKKEIKALNRARDVLNTVETRMPHTWSGGMIQAAVRSAEGEIFSALNALNSYGELKLSYEELHNRPETK